jgi:hypothetical protein
VSTRRDFNLEIQKTLQKTNKKVGRWAKLRSKPSMVFVAIE